LGLLVLACAATAEPLSAQANAQAWYDFEFNYPINPRLVASAELGPKVLVTGAEGWNSVDLSPGVEYSPNSWVDLLLYAPLSYTVQEVGLNTFEARASAGARFTLRPDSRMMLRNRTMFEYRNIDFVGSDSSQGSARFRSRVEFRVALNRPSYAANKMLYGITDFEGFLNLGQEPSERFLNRIRFRVGMGYRFTYLWRTEVIYTIQASRNTLGGLDQATQDHIFRFRLIHYLR
jgi:hypothetical protein